MATINAIYWGGSALRPMWIDRADQVATVLPFAVSDRWIVTVESERHFVKVRHYTRWYAVARRKGQEDRHHWCASRADARAIADIMREGFKEREKAERFQALYESLPDWKRAQFDTYLETQQGPG